MNKEKEQGSNKVIDIASLILMASSIVYSISLFSKGNREQAIFVGLWPPTFVALGTLLKQTFGNTGNK
ncbi:MAG TPA: hypothetical protein VH186_37380 [Chloroflexia bacterium]|nr:hypothetical protein [Chloroflexia bacterium]